LAFDNSLSADKAIRPGASGGIVVDSKTQQIVGILNAISMNGEIPGPVGSCSYDDRAPFTWSKAWST
jgi:hypothetical protein